MAGINGNFVYDSDFSKVTRDIQELVRNATHANSVFAQLNKTAASVKMEAARSFAAQAGFSGFKTQIVDLTGATEQFGQQLMKNKLTMKEYFKEAANAYKKDSKARALAEREVRRNSSAVVGIGDVNGRRKAMLVTPDSMDMSDTSVQLKVASKQYEIFNDLVQKGSTAMVNWGKNTQWAGRQLTVGLTVPMSIFASQAIQAFSEVDSEITRFKKVYGSDLTGAVGDATDEMLSQIQNMGSEFAKQYGIASKETIALAADLAAAGFEGQRLANAVNQTTRMMVLGEVDRQEAMKATLSIQTAFNQSSKELAQSVDFLNAVENSTSASLQDLTEAIPKTGPVIQALGGDIKDLSVLMTALREGGIAAGEGANAIKSGMAALISPTKNAIELSRQFGIDLEGIVKKNKGQLMPLLIDFQDQLRGLDDFGKARVIESIFGKYQFARISALFDNLNQQGSQTVGMIKLMNMSADELAKKSYSELQAQQNAPSTRLTAMQQTLQENLIKVGADLAETLLPIMQGALDILQKIVDGFNNLPGPIKSFAKIIAGVTGAAGPILMLAGIFGNLIGNAIKFGMSIVNMFKKLTGHPVQTLQILTDEELAAKLAANQLTGAYDRQRTSVMELNAALDIYIANLRTAHSIAPPGVVNPRRGPGPARFQTGGIVYAQNGMTNGRINGYGGGDKVPAMLEPGEFVINKQSSQKYKGLLTDINQGKDVPGYSKAGEVGIGGATPGTASNSISSGSEKSVSLKALLGFGGQTPEAALASLSDSEIKAFEKLLVKENDFKDVLGKLKRANIPGFKDIPLKDYALGLGTDRAHFAALENLLLYTDEADKVNKFVANKEFLFSTTSDSKGINQLVDNIKYPETLARLEKALGYIPGSLHRIIADTRPIIVNPELRDFFSRLQNGMMDINNPILQQELSDIILQKSGGGGFSANKAAKLVGAFAANEKAIAHSGDPIKVREILDSQIKHALAQTATKEEWQRIKQFHQGSINELIDMFMSGKPVDVDKVRRISSAFTNRRLLTDRESLILTEYRDISGEMKKLTNEQRSALAAIPESEKKALIKELGLAERVGVAKQEVLTTKGGRKAVRGISPKILSESMHGVPVGKGAGILPEVQLRKGFREVMTPRGPMLVPYANGGLVLPNGTSIKNGVLHAAGGFTGFGQGAKYTRPSWQNPMNKIKNPGIEQFRFSGEKIADAAGKSTKGELSGFYKHKGKQYYVKTFGDNISAVAEVTANKLLSKMFPGIEVPKSFISKIGNTNQLGAVSEIIGTRSIEDMMASGTKLREESALEAMLAQSVAGGRDLSPGNFMASKFGDRIVHVDPSEAFAKKLASGKPVSNMGELPSGADRALANFGVVKGGAKRYARDIVSGFGMSPGRAEVLMSRSLSKATSIPRDELIREASQVTKNLPKKVRREVDAWAKQLGHNSFEEAMVDIAMKRVQEVSSVIPQLAKSIGGKTTMSSVSGLSIRTKAQQEAYQKGLERLVTGSSTMDKMAIDAMTPFRDTGVAYSGIKNLPIQWGREQLPQLLKAQRQSLHDKMNYRGMGVTEEELKQMLSGNPFSLSRGSFASTSSSEAVAQNFAQMSAGNKKIVLRIRSGAGTWEMPLSELGAQGMYVKGQGAFKELENGILNGKAKVSSWQEKDGIVYADADLVESRALQYFAMGGPVLGTAAVKARNAQMAKVNAMARRKAAVFDIDKTIIQTVTGGRDWGQRTLESGAPMANQLKAIMDAQARGEQIVFLTARPSFMSPETIATLERLGIKDFKLRMNSRADGDPRLAHEYKVKAIKELQKDYEISSIWDDEFANITALRKEGLNVKIPVITNGHNPLKFATGGKLPGFGGGDKVPAMLEPGEFVINKDATKANLGLLEQINSNSKILKRKTGGIIPGFQGGGIVGNATSLGMNLMFMPMMIEQMKTSEGYMKALLAAVIAIQTLLALQSGVSMVKGGVGALRNAGATAATAARGGASAGMEAAALGGGKITQLAALSKAGALTGMARFGGMAASALLNPITAGVAVAGLAIIGGIMIWKKHVEDLAKTSRSYYREATEMAKVYNIELNKSSNAIKENKKYGQAFGTVGMGSAKGQVDKDYAKAVQKDYQDAIDGIKGLNTEQDKANRLASIYSSLVTQGFSLNQAKEITAEIARQAQATSAFNNIYPQLSSAIKDTETAMQVLDTTFAYHISQMGTAEEKASALAEAYARVQAASNINPEQSVISTQNLISTTTKNNGAGAVGDLVNAQLANAGIDQNGVNDILMQFAGKTDLDWGDKVGQELATTILTGLNNGMTKEDILKATDLKDLKIKVGVQVVAQEAKLALNKELELTIKELEKGIQNVNDIYDKKIDKIEKEKDAIQKAHDKKMKALEEEGKALQDRSDQIRDNADFYIKQLEKEYNAEQYYQNQRKNAIGGLESLSKGDVYGYLQSQMQSASDAAQFGREQAIQQIEDTRDAALKALDAQQKANNDAVDKLDEATQKQLQGKDDSIEALNKQRSKFIKDLKDRIAEAQAIMASPGIANKKIEEFQNKLKTTVETLPTTLQAPFKTVGNDLAGTISKTLSEKGQELNTVFVKNAEGLKNGLKKAFGTVKGTYDPKKGGMVVTYEFPGGYSISITDKNQNPPDDAGNSLNSNSPYGDTVYVKNPVNASGKDSGYTQYQWDKKGKYILKSKNLGSPLVDGNTSNKKVTKDQIKQYLNMGGKVLRFGNGNLVPGFGNSDSVNAMLTPGEFVNDRTATRRNLPVLQAMNAGATFTIPQLRGYNGTMESENETHNNNINMPINININGSNLTVDQVKNEIYGEIVRAKKMLVNSIGDYR